MIDNRYQPSEVEGRIYARWEQAGAFQAGRPERQAAETFCVVIPPPNVTGSLHMGHALNNTLQDILCRFERMRGKDVLWQPGTDHAGIATQMVVERQLMERQLPGRRDMGREAFLKRVWEWKEESGGTIINQLKRLGASCDWSRERFTMDEGLSRAVLKVFVQLYNEKLIYKDKRLVNWDPKLLTAISDLEVVQVEVKGHLWHLRYPLEGKTFNPDDPSTFIVVATTRPETMLGDTAVAVHPDDERYKHLVAAKAHVILPLVGRRIPIVADQYSNPEKGSGAVKITPAHDFNDFEVGKRQGLTPINILSQEAKMFLAGNADFIFGSISMMSVDGKNFPFPGQPDHEGHRDRVVEFLQHHGHHEIANTIADLEGVDRFIARKKIVARLEEGGLVEKIEPHTHAVPHGDRSNVVIEPFLTDQWYVDARTLAQPAIEAVREEKTKFIPKNWEKTYFEWMENIQPWCISRQLWWGHQIPCWYGAFRRDDHFSYPLSHPEQAHRFVNASEAEALEAAKKFYCGPVEIAESLTDAVERSKRDNSKFYIWRDEDVLDTWFSSALWPFSTLGWPDSADEKLNTLGRVLFLAFRKLQKLVWRLTGSWCPKFLIPKNPLDRYYPTNVLVTGFDIIFFWVARMMMMGLHFKEEIPFKDVYIHRLVRDASGAKMSKSKGNVVDPLGVIDEFGADALRFTLARNVAPGHDIRLGPHDVENNRNFATKLWNAARFVEFNGAKRIEGFDPKSAKEALNRWIAHETAKAAAEITRAIESYNFNEAAAAAYRFVWNVYCDWYVELSKPLLTGPDGSAKDETRAMAAWALDEILKILHPFMPFITEELWAVTAKRDGLLALTQWPDLKDIESLMSDADMQITLDMVDEIRRLRTTFNIPFKEKIGVTPVGFNQANTANLTINATSISRMANTSVSFLSSESDEVIQNFSVSQTKIVIRTPVREGQILVALPATFDLAAERARLDKELAKAEADIKRVDAKLSNEKFVANAPEEIVEEEKEKRQEAEDRRVKILEAMERLKGAA